MMGWTARKRGKITERNRLFPLLGEKRSKKVKKYQKRSEKIVDFLVNRVYNNNK